MLVELKPGLFVQSNSICCLIFRRNQFEGGTAYLQVNLVDGNKIELDGNEAIHAYSSLDQYVGINHLPTAEY